jgi:hypothetical protein
VINAYASQDSRDVRRHASFFCAAAISKQQPVSQHLGAATMQQLHHLWTISSVRQRINQGFGPTIREGTMLLHIIDALMSEHPYEQIVERTASHQSLLVAHHSLWMVLVRLGLDVHGYVRADRSGERLEWMYRWDNRRETGPFNTPAQAVEDALRVRLGQACPEDWL